MCELTLFEEEVIPARVQGEQNGQLVGIYALVVRRQSQTTQAFTGTELYRPTDH